MLVAALLPFMVVVGALVLVTQGAWPQGLVPTLGTIGVAGGATLALMNRLVERRGGQAAAAPRRRCPSPGC